MASKTFQRAGRLVSLGAVWLAGSTAFADPTVTQEPMGPDGDSLGGSLSPAGDHIAVLANKGSHLEVLYDGVAGPKIDALKTTTASNEQYQAPTYYGGQVPIVFSDDGAHWAYIARSGDDFVVMLDGKELVRGPLPPNEPARVPLTFSSKGHHLFFSNVDSSGGYQVVVDGKAGPSGRQPPNIAFSPDGTHYAYVGDYSNAGVGLWSFVDGRKVDYFGDNLQYTGHNVLVSLLNLPGGIGLLLNGKPEIKAVRLDPMWISPDGGQIAMVVTPSPPAQSVLTVNGKAIDGTQGLIVEKVYFSLDGKRWAALCDKKTGTKFMIVDGQKGEDYANIPISIPVVDNATHWRAQIDDPNSGDFSAFQLPVPGFTADSSKFVYVANAAGRQFMIVDGEESDGYQMYLSFMPLLSTIGHRIGLLATATNNKQHIFIDGAEINYGAPAISGTGGRLSQFTFSPGAKRYAFLKGYTLNVDNVDQPGGVNGTYVFSPDESHFAYETNLGSGNCVVVDGKVVSKNPGMVTRIFFSPDSQHIYWWSSGNWMSHGGTRDNLMLFVDAKPAVHFMTPNNGTPIKLNYSSDDVATFFALMDGSIKRFHVTSDTNLPAVLAAAPVAKAN